MVTLHIQGPPLQDGELVSTPVSSQSPLAVCVVVGDGAAVAVDMEDTGRIVLNVGGRRFETALSTVAAFPESLLGVMFSRRNAAMVRPDAHGEYFIDR